LYGGEGTGVDRWEKKKKKDCSSLQKNNWRLWVGQFVDKEEKPSAGGGGKGGKRWLCFKKEKNEDVGTV